MNFLLYPSLAALLYLIGTSYPNVLFPWTSILSDTSRQAVSYTHLIYGNAGPMSGVFSGLSMINEDAAFFMSVDTPFMEPETGIALLDADVYKRQI